MFFDGLDSSEWLTRAMTFGVAGEVVEVVFDYG